MGVFSLKHKRSDAGKFCFFTYAERKSMIIFLVSLGSRLFVLLVGFALVLLGFLREGVQVSFL